MDKVDRIFFEVGVADNVQYAGLVEPEWHLHYNFPGIPESTRWGGVLVDLQPHVIVDMLSKYHANPNLTILNAALTGKLHFSVVEARDGGEMDWEMRLDTAADYNNKHPNQFQKCFTVFAIDLKTLLSLANDVAVGFLSLDLQGSEVEVLEGYDWNVCPEFIEVEPHSAEAKRCVFDILGSNNYELIRSIAEEADSVPWMVRVNHLWRLK